VLEAGGTAVASVMQLCICTDRNNESRGSSAGIATGHVLDNQLSSSSPDRVKNFHFSISSRRTLWPSQSPVQWVLGTH
jgi:hypothetical protein